MSAERRADVPAPRAGPQSLSLAWVEREEGCNKVREFRWLSSKGSLTTPSPTCLSVPFSPLSLSLPCLSASENQSTQKQPCSVPPLLYRRFPIPSLPLSTSVSRRNLFAEARRAKEAKKAAATATSTTQPGSARNSRLSTPGPTATAKPSGSSMSIKKVPAGQQQQQQQASLPPPVPAPVNALRADMEAMGLGAPESAGSLLQIERAQKEAQRQRQREEDKDTAMATNGADDDAPVLSIAKEKILEEVRAKEKTEKPVLSLVVVGKCFPKTRLGCDALRGSHGRAPCQQVMSTQASRP